MDSLWSFFENLDEIVYAADLETHELVYMNKKALEAFGPDSPDAAAPRGGREPEPGRFIQRQYFDPRSGRRFLLRDTLLEEDGRRFRVSMALDLTRQESAARSGQELEALVRLKRADSVKTEFLSHMSHDIRTPINGILGMLSILEKNLDDPEKRRDCTRKIRVAAEHLLSLINDVLEISRLESGESALVKEPFSLEEVLESCAAILSPKAEEAGIRLEGWQADIRHDGLIGSPLHLRQILVNVTGNAVKYNRPGGRVFLRVRERPLRDGAAEYQFTVEDTGIGMTEEFQRHIFEPFVQARSDARTNYNGTGLGLAITKRLVDQMGGTIRVESRPGAGSRFQITLPLELGEARGPSRKPQEERADISGMRVLVAEDNALNREIVQYMLEDAGAAVVTAENGRAAVDLLAASEPGEFDCVLMDLMMPVMDGLEAARAIRAMDRPDVRAVPIIALSANSFREDARMALEAGMDAHLAKPADMDRLFRTMRKLRRPDTPAAGEQAAPDRDLPSGEQREGDAE